MAFLNTDVGPVSGLEDGIWWSVRNLFIDVYRSTFGAGRLVGGVR